MKKLLAIHVVPVLLSTTISHESPTKTEKSSQHALVTAKPDLLKRAATLDSSDPRFIGWAWISEATGDGEIVQRVCNTEFSYSVSAGYYNCCPSTGDCSFATSCIDFGTSHFQVFPNSVTSRCSSFCVYDWVYTAAEDTSPQLFAGCATTEYVALRTANKDDALGYSLTRPPGPSTVAFSVGYTGPTASSEEISSGDNQSAIGGSSISSGSIKITPLIGGIVAGVVVIIIVLLLFWRCLKSRGARRVNIPLQQYNAAQEYAGYPPGNFNAQLPYANLQQHSPGPLGIPVIAGPHGTYVPVAVEEQHEGYYQPAGQTSGILGGPQR